MASMLVGRVPVAQSVAPRKGNRLVTGLSSAERTLLEPHLKDVSLERGKVLQEAGESIAHVYFLYGGMVSLFAVMPDGEAVETMTVGREGAVGLSAGLGSRVAVHRAVVQLSGHAGQVSAPRWLELVQQSPALRDLVVRYNDVQLAYVQQSVACNALHDVESRLCRWLLQARDRLGSDTLPLTQEFLADMLGVRRTIVTIVARMLQSAGLVHYRRGIIHVRDVEGLERAACECYQAVRTTTDRLLGPET